MKLTIPECTKYIYKVIGNNLKENKTQDPDRIVITKQWSEFRAFKGYWIDVEYASKKGKKFDLIISFDITRDYVRVIGDTSKIPKFTPGTHNYPKEK